MGKIPKPVDFDGPHDDDLSGHFYVVEVYFDSKPQAQKWMTKELKKLDKGQKPRLLDRLFGRNND